MSVALAVTYEDCSSLIDSTVQHFVRRYGGHYDDLRADANDLFIKAYETYTETKGPFLKRVEHLVRLGLLYQLRIKLKRLVRFVEADLNDLQSKGGTGGFDLESFCEGLGRDAIYVVKLVVENRGEMNKGGSPTHRNKGGLRTRARARWNKGAVKRHLREKGWQHKRVDSVFKEIRSAL